MHFVPHSRFTMTHERFAPFNAYLGSEEFHQIFVKHAVKDVVFGHAHRSYGTVTIEGVTYHSRPLGYRREWDLTIDFVSNHPELNPSGTWNLSKRYNLVKRRPEFLEYEKKELANEFLSSMHLLYQQFGELVETKLTGTLQQNHLIAQGSKHLAGDEFLYSREEELL